LERVRESALLRALGITKRQLRRMLAAEGVIVSVAGTGAGLVLGVVLGWVLAAANGGPLGLPSSPAASGCRVLDTVDDQHEGRLVVTNHERPCAYPGETHPVGGQATVSPILTAQSL